MRNRIRVGVLLIKNNSILLVKHINPKDSYEFWVPPGGGIENDEDIFEAAKREVYEETGLKIEPRNIVYFRQFIFKEFQQNNIDIYITAKIISGNLTTENMYGKGNDEHFIKDLRYFDEKSIKEINVFPKVLQNEFWNDLKGNFPQIRFLGIEKDKE